MTDTREHIAMLGAAVALLVLSGIAPRDRLTWVLEVTLVIIAAPLLDRSLRQLAGRTV